MVTIIRGPQGCGKTRNAQAFAMHFGCSEIVDDWNGIFPLQSGALALTHIMSEGTQIERGRVLEYDEACRLARIPAA